MHFEAPVSPREVSNIAKCSPALVIEVKKPDDDSDSLARKKLLM